MMGRSNGHKAETENKHDECKIIFHMRSPRWDYVAELK